MCPDSASWRAGDRLSTHERKGTHRREAMSADAPREQGDGRREREKRERWREICSFFFLGAHPSLKKLVSHRQMFDTLPGLPGVVLATLQNTQTQHTEHPR